MLRKIINKFLDYFEKELKPISNYHIHPTVIIYNKENIKLNPSCLITEYVIIRAPTAPLVIGKNSQIGPFSVFLTGEKGIFIGDNVMIAHHCVFAAGSHEYKDLEKPMIFAGSFSKGPIEIGDDVWIGSNCTILDNVKIGKGAIVGANSLVIRDVEPYEIVGGVPAKNISSRTKYRKENETFK